MRIPKGRTVLLSPRTSKATGAFNLPIPKPKNSRNMNNENTQSETFLTINGELFSTAFAAPLLDRYTQKSIAVNLDHVLTELASYSLSGAPVNQTRYASMYQIVRDLRNVFSTGGTAIDLTE